MARRHPSREAVAQSSSTAAPALPPHLQSIDMLVTLSIASLIENNFPSIDHALKPSLLEILNPTEQFFHTSQQSAMVSVDDSRRQRLSHELKRRADIEHYRDCSRKPDSLHQEIVDILHVTLTMEVTYSDCEEMFIRGFKNLQNTTESCANIMSETNTIIQFPDRDEDDPDLIHQVTITGNLVDVEQARLRLRKFCPVVLMFAVSEKLHDDVVDVGLNEWLKKRTQDGTLTFPNISIQTLPQSLAASFKDPVIRVSGRVGEEQTLLEACERLRELLFAPEVAEKVSFSTHMEVPAAQRSQLVGTPDGAQLLVISRVTKALLHFPSNSEESPQTLFFYFTGQPEAILKARRYVQGLLPMQLCFHAGNEDLRAKIDAEKRTVKFYDEVLRVAVHVVPSDLESPSALPGDQMRHYISLRTSEYNVGALYAVMRRVLKRGDEIPMVRPTDYAEMLPLVPELIKHACEVNVKCRLEPCALHIPTRTSSSHSLEGNIVDQATVADHLADSADSPISSHGKITADLLPSARPRTYYNDRRGNPYRTYRSGNNPYPKHYLALRSRDEINRNAEGRISRNPSNSQTENPSRTIEGNGNFHPRRHGGCERFPHGAEWRASQSRPQQSSFNSSGSKIMLSPRPRNCKIELERRPRNGPSCESQQESQRPNRRMDVMDLIKLASAEDSERRKGSVEGSNSILDCADAPGPSTIVEPVVSDTKEALQE